MERLTRNNDLEAIVGRELVEEMEEAGIKISSNIKTSISKKPSIRLKMEKMGRMLELLHTGSDEEYELYNTDVSTVKNSGVDWTIPWNERPLEMRGIITELYSFAFRIMQALAEHCEKPVKYFFIAGAFRMGEWLQIEANKKLFPPGTQFRPDIAEAIFRPKKEPL